MPTYRWVELGRNHKWSPEILEQFDNKPWNNRRVLVDKEDLWSGLQNAVFGELNDDENPVLKYYSGIMDEEDVENWTTASG